MSTKNEAKSNKISAEIRSELSLALNNWQSLESTATKTEPPVAKTEKPQKKTKLLKVIQEQLETLSL